MQLVKKDNQPNLKSDTISQVKEWFGKQTLNQPLTTALFRKKASNLISSTAPLQASTPEYKDQILNAYWTNAKSFQNDNQTVIEVPVKSEGVFLFTTDNLTAGNKLSLRKSFTRLLFLKSGEKTECFL